MRILIYITLFVTLFKSVESQSIWKIGINYSYGLSTLYGNNPNNNTDNGTNLKMNYSLKSSIGTGVKAERVLKNKLLLVGGISYVQRGARFDIANGGYSPRYKFDYLDLSLGLKRYLGGSEKVKPFMGLNLCESTLLSANRIDVYSGTNLINDVQAFDYGLNINSGFDFKTKRDDYIQINLFYSIGFNQVFKGMMNTNGITGKNMLFGIQLGYLIGSKITK
jgi:hypothetical protein